MDIKLLGSKITKISAERNPAFSGKLSLDTNINLVSMEKYTPDNTNLNSLKVNATFKINYKELGSIEISGQLFLSCGEENINKILNSFESKKYNTPEIIQIMNLIMQKFSIRAFDIEEELGLPIHIKLPSLQVKSNI